MIWKMNLIVSAVLMVNLMWLGWLGNIPLGIWCPIYVTYLGLNFILSVVFHDNDRAKFRRAMKTNKEQFTDFILRRFYSKIVLATLLAIDDMKTYCKKHGISDEDTEIKDVLKKLENIKAFHLSFIKKNGETSEENKNG
jgi:hypothetical protein